MTCALLGAGSVAQAGHWKLNNLYVTGKTVWPEQSAFQSSDNGYGDSHHGEYPLSSSYTGISEGFISSYLNGSQSTKRGITLTRKVLGSGTAEFIWVAEGSYNMPDGSSPPPFLYVKVESSASGSASTSVDSGDSVSQDSVTLTVDNGYESAELEENPYSNSSSSRLLSGQITTRRLLRFATYGDSVVSVPLPSLNVVASARNDSFSFTYYLSTAYRSVTAGVNTGGNVTVSLDNRGAAISSGIEPSYKKVTNSFQLPRIFIPNHPNYGSIDTDKILSGTPWDGPGPWAVLCERERDGKMTVESAPQWKETTGGYSWWGGSVFDSNATGFPYLTDYEWTVSGGSATGTGWNSPSLDLGVSFVEDPLSHHMNGINLGGTLFSLGTSHSTLKVKATDDTGYYAWQTATAEAEYGVNWHLPYEWEAAAYKINPPIWDEADATTIVRGSAAATGSVSGKWRYQNFYIGALLDKDEGDVFGIAENLSSDPLSTIFYHACGIQGQQLADEDTDEQDGIFQTIWDSTMNGNTATAATWEGNRPTKDGSWDNSDPTKSLYKLTNPRMLKKYQIEFWRGDSYTGNGYHGSVRKPLRRRISGTWVTGDFVFDVDGSSGGE